MVSVGRTPSHPEQTSFFLTNPYSSSSTDTQPRAGMDHETYGPPPSSAGRRVVAQKVSSKHHAPAPQATQQSSREVSRSSRTAPYSQLLPSMEVRRHRTQESSAYLGEFSQFRSLPESSSLRHHGMHSLSVSPAGSYHSSSTSSYHGVDTPLPQAYSAGRSRPNPSTAPSPFNNTTPLGMPHDGRSTGSWYNYDISDYQNTSASHHMGQFLPQDSSTMLQTSFGSTPMTTAHANGMIYSNNNQTYTAPTSLHSFGVPSMYNADPHYQRKTHSSRQDHPSSNDFHTY